MVKEREGELGGGGVERGDREGRRGGVDREG